MINDDPTIAEKMPNTLEAWDNAVETYYYNYYSLQVGAQDFSMRAPDFLEACGAGCGVVGQSVYS